MPPGVVSRRVATCQPGESEMLSGGKGRGANWGLVLDAVVLGHAANDLSHMLAG
jgi:hypothetical protein